MPRPSACFLAACLALASFPARAAEGRAKSGDSPGFTFTASGDFGGNSDTRAVLGAIKKAKPAFHVALGDMSYQEIKPEAAWCAFVTESLGPTIPFELVPGNHDAKESNDGDIRKFAECLPHRIGNLTGNYPIRYFFDYPTTGAPLARVIAVSPGIDFGGITYDFKKTDGDYAWLAEAIDSAHKNGIPWIVVTMHKNCLSVGDKRCEIGPDLVNLLIDRKVDLLLQGHDHVYARSKPIKCLKINAYDPACVGNTDSKDYKKGQGLVTVITGTAGVGLYRVREDDAEAPYFAKFSGKNSNDASYGFLKIQVSAKALKSEFITAKLVADKPLKDKFTISAH